MVKLWMMGDLRLTFGREEGGQDDDISELGVVRPLN